MNVCVFTGRIVADPEIKEIASGKVANFRIAVRKIFKKQGEPDADFLSLIAYGKTADIIAEYCVKGKEISVSSYCQTRSYDKNGTKVYVTEFIVNSITLIGSKENGNEQTTPQPRRETATSNERPRVSARTSARARMQSTELENISLGEVPF